MENQCCDDIFTLHTPLIHPANDIQFALEYLNGVIPASITDIDRRNVQEVLERYFSLVGVPVRGERPVGDKNRVNLEFTTQHEFVAGSLEVYLSGVLMRGDPSDAERDYDVLSGNTGFRFRTDISKPWRLNKPPKQFESLVVNYAKRITFGTRGGT